MTRALQTLIVLGLALVTSAAPSWGQASVVVDDGIEFPDGSIQTAAAGIAQTGQMKCYDRSGTTGDEARCYDFTEGEDGEARPGYKWMSPRFIINGDATVTDTFTRLMWIQDANCIETHYPGFDTDGTAGDGFVTWDNAFGFVAGMNLGTYSDCSAGYDDWRVPSFREMVSLVHHAWVDPALCNTSCELQWTDGDPFTNLDVDATYWTSTTRVGAKTWAFAVDIGAAAPTTAIKTGVPPWPVWPVRDFTEPPASGSASIVLDDGGLEFDDGGVQDSAAAGTSPPVVLQTGQTICYQTDGSEIACLGTGQDGELLKGAEWPVPRFTDNGDGTVSDHLTGLVWLKDASCAGVPGWADALTFPKVLWDGSTLVGGGDCNIDDGSKEGDWRLPSIWELMSLLDYEYASPMVPNAMGDGQWSNGNPFINISTSAYYWSSTTSTDQPTHAFAVNFGSGYAEAVLKTDSSPTAWVVRNGR